MLLRETRNSHTHRCMVIFFSCTLLSSTFLVKATILFPSLPPLSPPLPSLVSSLHHWFWHNVFTLCTRVISFLEPHLLFLRWWEGREPRETLRRKLAKKEKTREEAYCYYTAQRPIIKSRVLATYDRCGSTFDLSLFHFRNAVQWWHFSAPVESVWETNGSILFAAWWLESERQVEKRNQQYRLVSVQNKLLVQSLTNETSCMSECEWKSHSESYMSKSLSGSSWMRDKKNNINMTRGHIDSLRTGWGKETRNTFHCVLFTVHCLLCDTKKHRQTTGVSSRCKW